MSTSVVPMKDGSARLPVDPTNFHIECADGVCTARLKVGIWKATPVDMSRVSSELAARVKDSPHQEYLSYGMLAETAAIDKDKRIVDFVASTDSKDRMGDIIEQDGWQLKNYRKNPVHLFAHDSRSLPIGIALKTKIEDGKLIQRVQYIPVRGFDLPDVIFQLIDAGVLRGISVGFLPIEFSFIKDDEEEESADSKFFFGSARRFIKQELLETSVVPIPANPQALVNGKSFDLRDFIPSEGRSIEWWKQRRKGFVALPGIEIDVAPKMEPEPEAWRLEIESVDLCDCGLCEANQALLADEERGSEVVVKASEIQTVLFAKANWTVVKARAWLESHKFCSDRLDETKGLLCFQQFDPDEHDERFKTLTQNLPKGVRLVACNRKAMNEEICEVCIGLRAFHRRCDACGEVVCGDLSAWEENGKIFHGSCRKTEETRMASCGICEGECVCEDKAVVPFKAHTMEPRNTPWNGPKEVAAIPSTAAGLRRLRSMSTIVVGKGDTKGDFKLPHHRASDTHVVFRGVTAALGRLNQTQASAKDKSGARRHLIRERERFAQASGEPFDVKLFEETLDVLWKAQDEILATRGVPDSTLEEHYSAIQRVISRYCEIEFSAGEGTACGNCDHEPCVCAAIAKAVDSALKEKDAKPSGLNDTEGDFWGELKLFADKQKDNTWEELRTFAEGQKENDPVLEELARMIEAT